VQADPKKRDELLVRAARAAIQRAASAFAAGWDAP